MSEVDRGLKRNHDEHNEAGSSPKRVRQDNLNNGIDPKSNGVSSSTPILSSAASEEAIAMQKKKEKLEAWRREREKVAANASAAASVATPTITTTITTTTVATPTANNSVTVSNTTDSTSTKSSSTASAPLTFNINKSQSSQPSQTSQTSTAATTTSNSTFQISFNKTASTNSIFKPNISVGAGRKVPAIIPAGAFSKPSSTRSVFGDNDDDDDDDEEESENNKLKANSSRKSKIPSFSLLENEAAAVAAVENGTTHGSSSNNSSTSSSTSSNDMDIDSTSNGNSNGKDVDPLDSYMTNVRAEVSQLNSVGKKSDSTADSAKNAATAESVIDDDLDDAQLIFGREDEDDLQTMAKNMLVAAKKKELAQVDHSKINYAPFRKDFYKEVKEIADMTPKEVAEYRASLDNIKVTGEKCPKPVKNWAQCGLSSKTLAILTEKYNFTTPTPIQCQAIPAIMSGRDIIAIAKTGSGKTLAFLLPMIRHILDQPARGPFEGPIAVILTPTRELATQIYSECKKFAKPSDLQTVCLYGGSDISEQIADLKRGADIVVCTPGRMIDMLAANSGRVINLRRTTYLVLDEADKMFDMGFEPQVMRIIDNIRPDRQTVLFSATFLRSMEALARKILHKPLEIIVGGRSIVSKDVTQEVIVIEENQKYFKLLEYLGIWQEKGSVLVFVERQEAADLLLKELFSSGYPCMSLHAGMDQGDRDSALVDFKNHDVRLLIATSVASRGLDVKELNLVVNYDVPNHYEDYVHRVGRTGRAGRKGTAVTFITPEQGRLAGDIIQALEASGTTPPKELTDLLKKYKEEKATGKAQASRFSVRHGKGYSFSEEENKKREEMRKMQKAAFGIQDSDDEDDSKQSNEASFEDEEMDDDIEKKLKANKVVISAPSASTTSTTTTTTTTATSTTTTTTTTTTATPTTTSSDAASTSTFSSGSAVPTASAAAASAAQRAKEIALQLSRNKQLISETSSTAATVVVEPPVPTLKLVEELEINDFPQRARWRVTQKESVAAIQELSNASITVRGTHFPAGKVPQPPERKLYLVIEADNELSVQKARNEIKRIIKEEITKDNEATLRTDSARPAGRYQVL